MNESKSLKLEKPVIEKESMQTREIKSLDTQSNYLVVKKIIKNLSHKDSGIRNKHRISKTLVIRSKFLSKQAIRKRYLKQYKPTKIYHKQRNEQDKLKKEYNLPDRSNVSRTGRSCRITSEQYKTLRTSKNEKSNTEAGRNKQMLYMQ